MDPEFLSADAEHQHDATVSSLSIVQPGDLDLDYMNEFMGWLLRSQGVDMYRMKGVLAIRHAEQKYVYQAVHIYYGTNSIFFTQKDKLTNV